MKRIRQHRRIRIMRDDHIGDQLGAGLRDLLAGLALQLAPLQLKLLLLPLELLQLLPGLGPLRLQRPA